MNTLEQLVSVDADTFLLQSRKNGDEFIAHHTQVTGHVTFPDCRLIHMDHVHFVDGFTLPHHLHTLFFFYSTSGAKITCSARGNHLTLASSTAGFCALHEPVHVIELDRSVLREHMFLKK